jgi:hypothetical protein
MNIINFLSTKFNNRNGFSIIESVIAAFVLSLGLIIYMNITQQSVKNIKSSHAKLEVQKIVDDITEILSSEEVCTANFHEVNAKQSVNNFTRIRLPNEPGLLPPFIIRYILNENIEGAVIKNIQLKENGENLLTNDRTELSLTFDYNGKQLIYKIPLWIQLAPPDNIKIEKCKSFYHVNTAVNQIINNPFSPPIDPIPSPSKSMPCDKEGAFINVQRNPEQWVVYGRSLRIVKSGTPYNGYKFSGKELRSLFSDDKCTQALTQGPYICSCDIKNGKNKDGQYFCKCPPESTYPKPNLPPLVYQKRSYEAIVEEVDGDNVTDQYIIAHLAFLLNLSTSNSNDQIHTPCEPVINPAEKAFFSNSFPEEHGYFIDDKKDGYYPIRCLPNGNWQAQSTGTAGASIAIEQ